MRSLSSIWTNISSYGIRNLGKHSLYPILHFFLFSFNIHITILDASRSRREPPPARYTPRNCTWCSLQVMNVGKQIVDGKEGFFINLKLEHLHIFFLVDHPATFLLLSIFKKDSWIGPFSSHYLSICFIFLLANNQINTLWFIFSIFNSN